MTRILITGSRKWDDLDTMVTALNQAWLDLGKPSKPVLVHGACPYGGADKMAHELARLWGWRVEAYPADFAGLGKKAGPLRNQKMVDLGADLCCAFPMADSRGTVDCIRRAQAAGIPVRTYRARHERSTV